MTDERAPSDAACIIPFASACTYEGAELQPPVSAIRRPFRVERDAVPDLSRSPRSNNIRRSVRVGFGLHDLRRREVAWQTKGDEIVQWKSQSVSGFDSKHAFDSAPGQIGQRPLVKTIKRYFGWTFGLPPGLPGGGITGVFPASGVGAFIPASMSGGQITPFVWPSFSLNV